MRLIIATMCMALAMLSAPCSASDGGNKTIKMNLKNSSTSGDPVIIGRLRKGALWSKYKGWQNTIGKKRTGYDKIMNDLDPSYITGVIGDVFCRIARNKGNGPALGENMCGVETSSRKKEDLPFYGKHSPYLNQEKNVTMGDEVANAIYNYSITVQSGNGFYPDTWRDGVLRKYNPIQVVGPWFEQAPARERAKRIDKGDSIITVIIRPLRRKTRDALEGYPIKDLDPVAGFPHDNYEIAMRVIIPGSKNMKARTAREQLEAKRYAMNEALVVMRMPQTAWAEPNYNKGFER